MSTGTRLAVAVGMLLATAQTCIAQEIKWSQTLTLPKGLNLPQGVKGELLGIELGDSYAEARKKIEAIKQAAQIPEEDKKLTEKKMVFQLPLPNGVITAEYPGGLNLTVDRVRKETKPHGDEYIDVVFSAPSSGQQVIGVKRYIKYSEQEDQIRVSELMARLKAKFKSEPQFWKLGPSTLEYVFQFDDGKPFNPKGQRPGACFPHAFGQPSSSTLKFINEDGKCDVMLLVTIRTGISEDHAESVEFALSDNERARKNLTADFKFFEDYIRSVQQQAGGAVPKL